MLFDKKAYYELIEQLKFIKILKTVLFIVVFAFLFFAIAYITKNDIILFSFLGILIGWFFSLAFNNDLQILEMQMKLDIYDKIMNLK